MKGRGNFCPWDPGDTREAAMSDVGRMLADEAEVARGG
jgi:hypothetical protein